MSTTPSIPKLGRGRACYLRSEHLRTRRHHEHVERILLPNVNLELGTLLSNGCFLPTRLTPVCHQPELQGVLPPWVHATASAGFLNLPNLEHLSEPTGLSATLIHLPWAPTWPGNWGFYVELRAVCWDPQAQQLTDVTRGVRVVWVELPRSLATRDAQFTIDELLIAHGRYAEWRQQVLELLAREGFPVRELSQLRLRYQPGEPEAR